MRLWLNGVNKIGELHGILYKEHRNVVATVKSSGNGGQEKRGNIPDDIPITLWSVKLGSESTDVTHGVRATSRALDS